MPRNSKLTYPATPRLPLFPASTPPGQPQRIVGLAIMEAGNPNSFRRRCRHARVMLVGEQPGDKEDLAGQPFVGPAGAVLDKGLSEAGIDRKTTYVTNAVKHFKWEPRGKRRIHKKPNSVEIAACRVAGHRDRTGEAGSHRLSGGYGRTGTIGAHISRDATAWTAAAVRISSALARHGASVVDLRAPDEKLATSNSKRW